MEQCKDNLARYRKESNLPSPIIYTIVTEVVLFLLTLFETNLLLSRLDWCALSGLFWVNVVYFIVVSTQLVVLVLQGLQLVD